MAEIEIDDEALVADATEDVVDQKQMSVDCDTDVNANAIIADTRKAKTEEASKESKKKKSSKKKSSKKDKKRAEKKKKKKRKRKRSPSPERAAVVVSGNEGTVDNGEDNSVPKRKRRKRKYDIRDYASSCKSSVNEIEEKIETMSVELSSASSSSSSSAVPPASKSKTSKKTDKSMSSKSKRAAKSKSKSKALKKESGDGVDVVMSEDNDVVVVDMRVKKPSTFVEIDLTEILSDDECPMKIPMPTKREKVIRWFDDAKHAFDDGSFIADTNIFKGKYFFCVRRALDKATGQCLDTDTQKYFLWTAYEHAKVIPQFSKYLADFELDEDVVASEGVFIVERIEGHDEETSKSRRQFLIKWKDYPSGKDIADNWQPDDCLIGNEVYEAYCKTNKLKYYVKGKNEDSPLVPRYPAGCEQEYVRVEPAAFEEDFDPDESEEESEWDAGDLEAEESEDDDYVDEEPEEDESEDADMSSSKKSKKKKKKKHRSKKKKSKDKKEKHGKSSSAGGSKSKTANAKRGAKVMPKRKHNMMIKNIIEGSYFFDTSQLNAKLKAERMDLELMHKSQADYSLCDLNLDPLSRELLRRADLDWAEYCEQIQPTVIPTREVDLMPLIEGRKNDIVMVVGPSGSGKSTLLRRWKEAYGDMLCDDSVDSMSWDNNLSVIDHFSDTDLGIELLGSIGLNSIPVWTRPFAVLSQGEQYRASFARLLERALRAEHSDNFCIVLDEFTSVLDRDSARCMSASIRKFIQRRNKERAKKKKPPMAPFVLLSANVDIARYLQPSVLLSLGGDGSAVLTFHNENEPSQREIDVKAVICPDSCRSVYKTKARPLPKMSAKKMKAHKELKRKMVEYCCEVQNTRKTLEASAAFDYEFDGKIKTLIPFFACDGKDNFRIFCFHGISGTGKTTSATRMFGDVYTHTDWYETNATILSYFAPYCDSLVECEEVFAAVGLPLRIGLASYWHLSEGERERVRIARTLFDLKKGLRLNGSTQSAAEETSSSKMEVDMDSMDVDQTDEEKADESSSSKRTRTKTRKAKGSVPNPEKYYIIDEFTSFLDRRVAKRVVRGVSEFMHRHSLKGLVLVCCHLDVLEVMNPCFLLDFNEATLLKRKSKLEYISTSQKYAASFCESSLSALTKASLMREEMQFLVDGSNFSEVLKQPVLRIYYKPVGWRDFNPTFGVHHYKDLTIAMSSRCFRLFGRFSTVDVDEETIRRTVLPMPVGFLSYIFAFGKNLKKGRPVTEKYTQREHRTVILPQFQSLGIASRSCDGLAEMLDHCGEKLMSKTAHPKYGTYRDLSPLWTATGTNHKKDTATLGWHCGRGWAESIKDDNGIRKMFYSHWYRGKLNDRNEADEAYLRKRVVEIYDSFEPWEVLD